MGDSQSKTFGDDFLTKLQGELGKPAPVFGKSLFAGPSNASVSAWNTNIGGANDIVRGGGFTSPMRGAMDAFGGLGKTYGDLGKAYDPNSEAYQTLRQGVTDDTLASVNSMFGGSGRLGSGLNYTSAAKGLGSALAGLDYGNMQNDINNRFRAADSQAGI